MKKFKVTLVVKGQYMETIIHAGSQAQAIALAKEQYPTADVRNAVEIR